MSGTLESCTICLSSISDRAIAVPCNHLSFDFVCLVQWLQTSAVCPLCKHEVSEVQYDFRDVDDFKRYRVPRALSIKDSGLEQESRSLSAPCEPVSGRIQNAAITFRRHIYEANLFSSHVGSSQISGYKDFTPQQFDASADLQSRARHFLRRELQVFDTQPPESSDGSRRRRGTAASQEYMVEYFVAVLRTHDLKSFDGRAIELVAEFIGNSNARLLLHELHAWLRSPFRRLQEWDQAVQYADHGR